MMKKAIQALLLKTGFYDIQFSFSSTEMSI